MAEQKARERANKRAEEEMAAELAASERKTQARRRVMLGGGVTVGVVALVASFYSASAYSQQKNAQRADCVATNPETGKVVAQPEKYCDEGYAQSHGGHQNPSTGLWMMPMFLPGGGVGPSSQYRYSYSPASSPAPKVGQSVTNPNFTKPSGSRIQTNSGKTIQRSGFGLNTKSGVGS